MRLLFIAPILGPSGRVPDVFETLSPLLGDAGHDVEMSSHRADWPSRSLDQAHRTWRHRRRGDVLIVHLYSGRAFAVEDLVARLAGGVPLVGVLAGGGFPAFARRHPRWVRRVLARFDHLVAPSEHLARWAREAGPAPVTVIPNPLDLGPYPHRLRTEARPRLLWLRAYHEIYAPEVAVEALALVAGRHADARLTMVGDDKGLRSSVAAQAERLGVADRVRVGGFAGPDEKRLLFEDHDVFVNTSRVDNRPVSVVEAAACGLCVVSTAVGGIPDLLTDGESALLVDPDDPGAVADAVERLVTDADLARRVSAGGRLVAEEGTPDRVVERWGDLLRRLGRAPG